MVPGKRYAVFAIRQGKHQTIWIRAGVAYVQPDDSMNLTLDVLPMDGQLHIREIGPKHQQLQNPNHRSISKREEPAAPALDAQAAALGGH